MTAGLSLVPWPTSVEPREGELPFAAVYLVSRDSERWTALAAELLAPLGVTVSGGETVADVPASEPAPTPVVLVQTTFDGTADDEESYTLEVHEHGVTLTAGRPAGLLHALRTLRQLVTAQHTVPFVVVRDTPRYRWRGLTLDVVRHWHGPETIRRVIDLLGAYKLRVLHLHLTDDQGWRIELPSHPELTERSGRTQVGGEVAAGERGYLTADEFRELQEYAAARFVEVIPEIDLPGHTFAATHACPELVPGGEPTPPYLGTDVGASRLWADNPATEPWMRDVLGDLAAMTTGRYVHVGGDEALTLERDEYVRLVEIACDAVRAHGKTPAGWQEIAATAVEPGTVVQFWDPRVDPQPLLDAANAGARVVMSPAPRAYCDMKYDEAFPLGLAWAGHVEVRDAYDWDPDVAVPGLPASSVAGVSAALWTETLETSDHLFTMLLPRLPALAEVAWTEQPARDWESFRARLAAQVRVWDAEGWAWHPSPQVAWPDR